MRTIAIASVWVLACGLGACSGDNSNAAKVQGPSFALTLPSGIVNSPQDGRVILLLSSDFKREPKDHVEANLPLDAPYMLGANVEGWAPGATVSVGDDAFGWPAGKLSGLPTGDYSVHVVLNRYETFHLANGRTLKLPPDQ